MKIPDHGTDTMTFDTPILRAGTHCSKWDTMEALYGLSPVEGEAPGVGGTGGGVPFSGENS